MQAYPQSNKASKSSDRVRGIPPVPPPGSYGLISGRAAPVPEPTALAHDAANLLGALILYCDLLNRPGVLRDQHRHYGAELSQLAQRSSDLIERLLGLSGTMPRQVRLHPSLPEERRPGRRPLPPVPVQEAYAPARLLRELEPLLRSLAHPHASLQLRLPEKMPLRLNPPSKSLETILVNLVCNAAQALAPIDPVAVSKSLAPPVPKGRIVVSLRRAGRSMVLEVADNGPGIAAEKAASFLVPSEPQDGGRHGLGHRIVHQHVSESGAQLAISTRPDRGTTFFLSWPDQRLPRDAAAPPSPTAGLRDMDH